MEPPDLFKALVREHAELIHRTARRVGVPAGDLADIAQAVFSKLHQTLPRLDTSKSLAAWVRKTTFRIARDHLALAYHAHEVSSLSEAEAHGTSTTAEDHMGTIDAQAQVHAVLDTLRPALRMVLVMHDMEELPMREVAEVLEIPMSTGYSRLHVARQAFKQGLDERRASEATALAPFALWTAGDLLAMDGPSIPRSPPGFEDEVWRRLVDALGTGIVGAGAAGAAGAAGGAAAAGAVKAGLVLTATQAAVGAVTAALVGAGIAAAVLASPAPAAEQKVTAVAEIARRDATGAGSAPAASAPAVSAPVVPAPVPVVASAGRPAAASTAPKAAGAATPIEEDEAVLLENAGKALDRGAAREALATLDRIRSKSFAGEREALRRRALAYLDGGR